MIEIALNKKRLGFLKDELELKMEKYIKMKFCQSHAALIDIPLVDEMME
jgi:hypothetical protein